MKIITNKRSWRGQAVMVCSLSSLMALTQVGCGSSSSSTSTTLAVSGTLSTAASTSSSARISVNDLYEGNSENFNRGLASSELLDISKGGAGANEAVDFSTMTMNCTLQDGSSTVTTSSISSTGAFTVPVVGGAGVPMSCSMKNAAGTVVGTVVVSDSTNKDMYGKSGTKDQLKATSSASLGAVSYDSTTQEAIATSASGLSSDSLSASTAFDPTGVWKVAANTVLDPGFKGPCASGNTDGTCNGPAIDSTVFMNRLVGTSTTDNSTVFGLQLWNSQANYTACGSMSGLSATQAATAGISVPSVAATSTNPAMTAGAFAFTTTGLSYTNPSTVTGDTMSNGYQLSSAKTSYPMSKSCKTQSVTVGGVPYQAWVCGPQSGLYQASLSGGCVTTGTTTPVNVDNWSGMTGGCTNSAVNSSGYVTNTCTGTYKSGAVTCTNTFGTFSDAALTTPSGTGIGFDWTTFNATDQIAAGTLCSALTAGSVSQAQCYSQWYQSAFGNNNNGGSSTYCMPKVNTDWTATTAANFVSVDFKPSALMFMDKMVYQVATNGTQTAVLRTTQDQNQGVPIQSNGQNTWIPCKTHEVDTLRMTKVDATHLRMTFVSNVVTQDTAKPACVAKFGKAGDSSVQKFQFNVVKQ